MSTVTQTESGKAWEYGLAQRLTEILQVNLSVNKASDKGSTSYKSLPTTERTRIDAAAGKVVYLLRTFDDRLLNASQVIMQSDMRGAEGDVRDIIIYTNNGEEVGISAKHRHKALKHPRLSDNIDFGQEWYCNPCSKVYWQSVKSVFQQLRRKQGQLWRDLPNKHTDYYQPILNAFIQEVKQHAAPKKMMHYLLGRYDFYKTVKENGQVSVGSFNIFGTLKWGKRVAMPNRIVEFKMKSNSKTTAILIADEGWQISFRLHNADSRIQPSLKFDVCLIGSPETLIQQVLTYG